ncbi:helix-turn-helix domain-containing protein [Streptomyces phage Alderaan]|nr:helix-turn-helix domain-containing protein [Streptomyces phage Alderaan]
MATPTLSVDERRAMVHKRHGAGASHRAIGRELGIHHTTVARILRTTPAPQDAPPALPDAPPAPTSNEPRPPAILFNLTRELIQDLNTLADKGTGDLPAPLVRAIHAAADRRRAAWLAWLRRQHADRPVAGTDAPA